MIHDMIHNTSFHLPIDILLILMKKHLPRVNSNDHLIKIRCAHVYMYNIILICVEQYIIHHRLQPSHPTITFHHVATSLTLVNMHYLHQQHLYYNLSIWIHDNIIHETCKYMMLHHFTSYYIPSIPHHIPSHLINIPPVVFWCNGTAKPKSANL